MQKATLFPKLTTSGDHPSSKRLYSNRLRSKFALFEGQSVTHFCNPILKTLTGQEMGASSMSTTITVRRDDWGSEIFVVPTIANSGYDLGLQVLTGALFSEMS